MMIKNRYLLFIEAISLDILDFNLYQEHNSSISAAKEYLNNIKTNALCSCKTCYIEQDFLYPIPKPLEFLIDLARKDLESGK